MHFDKKLKVSTIFLLFKNRDFCKLIRAWLIFCIWATGVHYMNIVFCLYVYFYYMKNKRNFPKFLFVYFDLIFFCCLTKSVVFSALMLSAWGHKLFQKAVHSVYTALSCFRNSSGYFFYFVVKICFEHVTSQFCFLFIRSCNFN